MEPGQAGRQLAGPHQGAEPAVGVLVAPVRESRQRVQVVELVGDEAHAGPFGDRADPPVCLAQAFLVAPPGQEVRVVVPEQQGVAVVAELLGRLGLVQTGGVLVPTAPQVGPVDLGLGHGPAGRVAVLAGEAPPQRTVGGVHCRGRPEQQPGCAGLLTAVQAVQQGGEETGHAVRGARRVRPGPVAEPGERGHQAPVLGEHLPGPGVAGVHGGEQQFEVRLLGEPAESLRAGPGERLDRPRQQLDGRRELHPVALVHVDDGVREQRGDVSGDRPAADLLDQPRGVPQLTSPGRRDGRPGQSARPLGRVGGERRRAVEQQGRLGVTAAPHQPVAGLLEAGREVVVGEQRRAGLVHQPPRVVGGQALGQQPVRLALPGAGGPGDDGPAHQRVPEAETAGRVEPGQPAGLQRLQYRLHVLAHRSQPGGRAPGRPRPGQGGQQQDSFGGPGESGQAVREQPFQPPSERQLLRQRNDPAQLAAAQLARQLHQGERIAARLVQQAGRRGAGQARVAQVEQFPGLRGRERADLDRVHRPGLHRRVLGPAGADDDDRQGRDPPVQEGEDRDAGGVHPVQVVDQQQQRTAAGRRGEQREGRRPHGEAARRRTGAQAERVLQDVPLMRRQVPDLFEEGPEDLVEAAERVLALHFGADRPQHGEPGLGRSAGGPLQQGRLADAGLAAQQHRRPAAPGPRALQGLAQPRGLPGAPYQPCRSRLLVLAGLPLAVRALHLRRASPGTRPPGPSSSSGPDPRVAAATDRRTADRGARRQRAGQTTGRPAGSRPRAPRPRPGPDLAPTWRGGAARGRPAGGVPDRRPGRDRGGGAPGRPGGVRRTDPPVE